MALRDLMPWSGTRSLFRKDNEDVPFLAMQDRLSRMFDELVSDFGLEPWDEYPERPRTYLPRIDVVEEKDALTVTADLPGMDEKDIKVTVTPDGLTIHAERTSEKVEEEGREYYRRERTYGEFHRTIPLPVEIDADKSEATFKRGVLKIRLPKSKVEPETRKHIPVKAEL